MGISNKPLVLVLVLFHVVFIFILPLNILSSPTTEAEALVKWKNTLLESSSLDSWSLNNFTYLCNWTGITCNTAGTVLELRISNQGLNGTLAHFNFSSFPNLTSLDMSINKLSDSIPVNIGNATQLQHLNLLSNNLNGKKFISFFKNWPMFSAVFSYYNSAFVSLFKSNTDFVLLNKVYI